MAQKVQIDEDRRFPWYPPRHPPLNIPARGFMRPPRGSAGDVEEASEVAITASLAQLASEVATEADTAEAAALKANVEADAAQAAVEAAVVACRAAVAAAVAVEADAAVAAEGDNEDEDEDPHFPKARPKRRRHEIIASAARHLRRMSTSAPEVMR